jgi:hypothetical protein
VFIDVFMDICVKLLLPLLAIDGADTDEVIVELLINGGMADGAVGAVLVVTSDSRLRFFISLLHIS